GEQSERAKTFADLLVQGALKDDIPVLYTNSTEGKPLSCLLIHIWRCGFPFLMNSIHMLKCAALIQNRLSMVSGSIHALAHIITTRRSAMGATVCRKIRNSF